MSAPQPPPAPLPVASVDTGDDGQSDKFDFLNDVPARPAQRPKATRGQNINATIVMAVVAVALLLVLGVVVQSSGSHADAERPGMSAGSMLLMPLLVVAGGLLYFLPTFIAYSRDHSNTLPIAIVNIFFGWTLIGWVGSLAWSLSSAVKESRVYVKKVVVGRDEFDDGEDW